MFSRNGLILVISAAVIFAVALCPSVIFSARAGFVSSAKAAGGQETCSPRPDEQSNAMTGPTDRTPGRMGAYVTFRQSHLNSSTNLSQLMEELKSCGVDFIIPFMAKHTSGTVNWDSRIAPEELIGDRTYMQKILTSAHAVGLKVYPAFGVMTEGGERGPNALLQKYPEWAFHYHGERQGYIDPGNADARQYQIDLIVELITQYNVDGLSLDYMRCPNRVGYTDTGREYFLRRHNIDLAQITGIDDEVELDTEGGRRAISRMTRSAREHPIWTEWKRWRTDQVNDFMRQLAEAVRSARPELPISSYVWGARTYTGTFESCQDWMTWIREGWLDWINPSGYRYTDEEFHEAVVANRTLIPVDFPYYITIGVATSHGSLESADDVIRYLKIAAEEDVDGIIFFRWHSLQPFLPDVAPYLRAWPDLPESEAGAP